MTTAALHNPIKHTQRDPPKSQERVKAHAPQLLHLVGEEDALALPSLIQQLHHLYRTSCAFVCWFWSDVYHVIWMARPSPNTTPHISQTNPRNHLLHPPLLLLLEGLALRQVHLRLARLGWMSKVEGRERRGGCKACEKARDGKNGPRHTHTYIYIYTYVYTHIDPSKTPRQRVRPAPRSAAPPPAGPSPGPTPAPPRTRGCAPPGVMGWWVVGVGG